MHFYSCRVSGASTDNLPPGVLYKVKATYKYQAEDMDELAFEVGEIIDVIEYEDPEEQVRQQDIWTQNMEILSFNVTGGGMADGSQGYNRTKGSLPGQLHKAYLKCLNFSNLIVHVVYLQPGLCALQISLNLIGMTNFSTEIIVNMHHASNLNELCFLLKIIKCSFKFLDSGQSFAITL